MKGCGLGLAQLGSHCGHFLPARRRQALALPWLLGGAWTPCTVWAAVLVSHPRGEACSSDGQRTASHLSFSLASVAGSAGLLCRGGVYADSEKGAVPYKPTSPLQRSVKGLQGFLRGRVTVHGRGVAGGVRPGPPPISACQLSQGSPAQHAPLAY